MTHTIKIKECYADAVYDGRKTFEVRENDRGYNAGDIVRFEVIYSDGCQCSIHPLNDEEYRITYVHSGLGMKEGYVVFGISIRMTKEIQKAIDYIHAYMHPVDDSESEKRKLKYRDMAIRSLEAWEKVKAEIDEKTEIHSDGEFYIKNFDVKRIIDKHLSEVEVSNATDQAPTH